MRFSEDFRDSVGFVLDDGDPCGAFFIVEYVTPPPRPATVALMVTARHCFEDVTSPGARYRGKWSANNSSADIPEWEIPLDEWVFPADENIDLAVTLFRPDVPLQLGLFQLTSRRPRSGERSISESSSTTWGCGPCQRSPIAGPFQSFEARMSPP